MNKKTPLFAAIILLTLSLVGTVSFASQATTTKKEISFDDAYTQYGYTQFYGKLNRKCETTLRVGRELGYTTTKLPEGTKLKPAWSDYRYSEYAIYGSSIGLVLRGFRPRRGSVAEMLFLVEGTNLPAYAEGKLHLRLKCKASGRSGAKSRLKRAIRKTLNSN